MCGEFSDLPATFTPSQALSPQRSPSIPMKEPVAFLPSPPTLSRRNSVIVDSTASSPFLLPCSGGSAPTEFSDASSIDLQDVSAEPTTIVAQYHEEWVHTVRFTSKTRRAAPAAAAIADSSAAAPPKPSFLKKATGVARPVPTAKVVRDGRYSFDPYAADVFRRPVA